MRAWWARLAESGWGFPTWPQEWFGQGLSADAAAGVRSAFAEVGALPPPTGLGQLLGGPMLLIHGSEEQKARFLPALVRGEELWCQFFSEPGSGSDLASAQTRAVHERRRLDGQRPEGVDLRGPVRRPRDAAGPDRPGGAQAPGPELLHHRRRPARHRGQAAAPDERPARLQRGVLHRRAHRRGPADHRGGQRLVGRGDGADVRAFLDRPAVGHAGSQGRPAGRAGRRGGRPGGRRRARPAGPASASWSSTWPRSSARSPTR